MLREVYLHKRYMMHVYNAHNKVHSQNGKTPTNNNVVNRKKQRREKKKKEGTKNEKKREKKQSYNIERSSAKYRIIRYFFKGYNKLAWVPMAIIHIHPKTALLILTSTIVLTVVEIDINCPWEIVTEIFRLLLREGVPCYHFECLIDI